MNPGIDDAVADANRTLEGKSTGSGHYVVTAVEVKFLRYDEERDIVGAS